jgi:chromosome segregation ATPase
LTVDLANASTLDLAKAQVNQGNEAVDLSYYDDLIKEAKTSRTRFIEEKQRLREQIEKKKRESATRCAEIKRFEEKHTKDMLETQRLDEEYIAFRLDIANDPKFIYFYDFDQSELDEIEKKLKDSTNEKEKLQAESDKLIKELNDLKERVDTNSDKLKIAQKMRDEKRIYKNLCEKIFR